MTELLAFTRELICPTRRSVSEDSSRSSNGILTQKYPANTTMATGSQIAAANNIGLPYLCLIEPPRAIVFDPGVKATQTGSETSD